ncbi:MAG: PTS sugar transporter subunit IIA [Thermogemmatispora sp.]|uniref:PTS sugar transporter subunit IIA n=1 Tax=Thermogemmatispora TaxID=768669 RepID=UPI00124E5791|nr:MULTISPECIES: PTS sugar transporter subunit IIA [Thermogemmatispora]MBE3566284.1 PTS sugar transporter subunit IIA [Thermogemmatispora sp.]GER84334.1 PTS sugar transporter subunit IIA [Thermogemmatispora aurantia]
MEPIELELTLNGVTMPVLVLWGLTVRSKEELFARVHEELLRRGQVRPSYLEGVQERERQYPTGLDFGDFAVALPHVDFEHVLRPALVVALLSEALPFQAMDDPTRQHLCRLAIFPVLTSGDTQLAFLQAVTCALQQPGFYTRLISLQTPQEISACLQSMLQIAVNEG